MKKLFFVFVIMIAAVPGSAQWKDANLGAQVLAFGVHDTTLFVSAFELNPNTGNESFVLSYTPPNYWGRAESGIDFTQGNVTSFASLGPYFFAGMTRSSGAAGTSWRTSDGQNWSASAGGNVCTADRYVFNATGGIYRSTDSGAYDPWEQVSTFSATGLTSNGVVVYAWNANDVWRSTDTGGIGTWTQLHPPFSGMITVMDSLLFMVSSSGQLAKSTDSGSDWSTLAVDSAGVPVTVNVLATDGKNLFAGTPKGLMVSTDTGKDWMAQNYGLDFDYIYHDGLHFHYTITALTVFDTLLFAEVLYDRAGQYYYLAVRPISELTAKAAVREVAQQQGDFIEVYPNPATGLVTILAGGTNILGVSVLNVLGSETGAGVRGAGSGKVNLDLSKLPSGTYFLQIETAKGTVMRKVVRE
jgi:hypothetical protein